MYANFQIVFPVNVSSVGFSRAFLGSIYTSYGFLLVLMDKDILSK